MCSNAVLGSCLCVYFIYLVHASIVDVICNGKITIIFSERSRSLYAIACLSVVCDVCALYSDGSNFWQYFCGIGYLGHSLTSIENFTEIVLGEPLRWGS